MWKLVNGELVNTVDLTRVKFRTNISKQMLDELREVASNNNTHVNYLIETGLEALFLDGTISFDKKARPKDRIQYKTTYNEEMLQQARVFAKTHHLFINDVIEYSMKFIDVESAKSTNYRNRIVK